MCFIEQKLKWKKKKIYKPKPFWIQVSSKKIETDGTALLELSDMTFEELLSKIQPDQVIGFSTEGKKSNCEDISQIITKNSCIVIGGFQKGHFNQKTSKQFSELRSIYPDSLESHVVASRILYEYEKTIFI